jgi:formate dehydrogenase iron-sulfur subunit
MADMKKLSGVDILGRRKALLITPELCTACRGCQTACKEWNHLPAERTKNRGTYENPPDLTPNLYNKIRFKEMGGKAGLEWLFISQRCMHCGDPGCLTICPAPGAITKTSLGVVVYDKSRCIGCKLCRGGCPFDVPRYDENDKISKCHMCWDRVSDGMAPACAKVCPTGAISFGDRVDMIARAKRSGYKTVYGEKDLAGLGVLYAFKYDPQTYGFDASPDIPASVAFWRTFLKPLTVIGLGASLAAVAAHYLAVGPHDDGGDSEGGEG